MIRALVGYGDPTDIPLRNADLRLLGWTKASV